MRSKRATLMNVVVGFFALAVIALAPGVTWALAIGGTAIIAIDGNSDGNVTVNIASIGGTTSYDYGYFLNGGSTFHSVIPLFVHTFQGGDIIDFALYDGANYYTLSGDAADTSYSVLMDFGNPVTVGSPQQPAGWTNPYYYNANITWTLANVVNTNELALNFRNNGNDGIAPVPEPTALLLLGSGLLGLGILGRKRLMKRA